MTGQRTVPIATVSNVHRVMKRSDRVETVTDSWTARNLTDQGLGVWLRDRLPKTGDDDLDELIESSVAEASGFPLKSVSVVTTTNKKGKKSTSTHSMQVVELRKEEVDPEFFILPTDYEEITLTPQAQGDDQPASPLSGLFGGKKKKKKKDG